MATIQTAIRLNDMMTAPIRNITNAMNMMLSSWTSLEGATSRGLDVDSVETIRSELNKATTALDQMGKEQEEFNQTVNQGQDAVSGLGSKIASMVGKFVSFALISQEISKAVNYASDLQEVQNVVDVSFGKSAQAVNEWSKTTLEAYGLNELSAKRYAGTMGAMLKSSGMTGDAVTEMSMKITELAGDMASFYNLQSEEAFAKIQSGISGETEPLKRLGINMSVANLEAFALSQGIKTAYNEMSQAEQVTLRYNYLLQATADAQGDFARTSGSFANQQKLLTETWQEFTGMLATYVLPLLSTLLSVLNNVISFISDNWSIISPILMGVATALALINAPLLAQAGLWLWNSVLVPAYTAVLTFLKIGYGVLTGSTAAASAAQFVYNNALLACPLTWILLIIIAVIAAIYAIVAAINKLTGTTISATGVIAGTITAAVSVIWNLFLTLLSLIIQNVLVPLTTAWDTFANFFGNIFTDPIATIIRMFEGLANAVLGILKTIATGIDFIFGSNLAGTVQGWMDGVSGTADKLVAKYGNGTYEEKSNLTGQLQGMLADAQTSLSWQTSDAYNTGYEWGAGVEDSISNTFGGGLGDQHSMENLMESIGDTPAIGDIVNNTADTADALDITNENLKYLRDLAEQDAINRFTTAEIRVEMTNHNNISSTMDLDGVFDYMTTGVQEAMEHVAEGVHA